MSDVPTGTAFLLTTPEVRHRAEAGDVAAAEPAAADRIESRSAVRYRRMLLAAMLLIAVVLGTRGITSEASVSLYDTPRYLMNGAFMADFLRSGSAWSFDGAVRYAEHYYARYPALSLGHHPPLISVALVPFFSLFGVSVFWPRMVALGFFLLATGSMFSLVRRFYGLQIAVWATLLFVTNPFVVTYGQQVLSEMPMLALVLFAMNALVKFSESGRTRDFAWFVAGAVASLYAKQLAIYLFPVYTVFLFARVGWRRLVQRDVMVLTAIGAVLGVPIVVMTLSLAPASVAIVQRVVTNRRGLSVWQVILSDILSTHLRLPVAIAVGTGIVASLLRRDRRIFLGLAWLGAVIGSVILFTGRFDSARYAFAALPAYFLCAASLACGLGSRAVKVGTVAILALAVGSQLWGVRSVRPTGADGYEAAAQYVVSQSSSPTVLFSGPVDVGYFPFFVRKHDPAGRIVVLRSDKLFATWRMSRAIETRIAGPEEIYPLLRQYGTRFVVIEDRPGGRFMNWLRDEVKGDRFIERLRVPIGTRDPRLRGVDLVVYEYKEATAPDPHARIDIKIPLVSREINVELADLIGR